ncbi:MAG: acylphosphatase [Patescibacteria group bacterium]|nr:acylphosphatase [Patescibacteria group bacterium]
MQARVLITGFIQGVGFRQHIKRKARSLGLTGWVRNLPDRRVEALFSGPKEKIEEAISECSKGPFFSEVKSTQVSWEKNKEEFTNFDVRA